MSYQTSVRRRQEEAKKRNGQTGSRNQASERGPRRRRRRASRSTEAGGRCLSNWNQSSPRKHYLSLSSSLLFSHKCYTPCFLLLYLFINIYLYSCVLSACFPPPALSRLIIISLKEIFSFERLITHLIGILSIHYLEPARDSYWSRKVSCLGQNGVVRPKRPP